MISKIYIAYDFTDDDKQKIIKLFHHNLSQYENDVILHEPEYLHSTIAFIGEAKTDDAIALKDKLKKIDTKDIILEINGECIVLGDGHKKYLTLKIKNTDKLTSIYKEINELLNNAGLEVKNKDYLPHISLGRLTSKGDINEEKIYTVESLNIQPTAITIFKSVDYSKEL